MWGPVVVTLGGGSRGPPGACSDTNTRESQGRASSPARSAPIHRAMQAGAGGGLLERLGGGAPFRLLYVDDEAPMRVAFARALAPRGYRVDVAGSGEEALRMAAAASYPVVVTDLAMPGLDGVDLIRQLQKKHPSMVFVILTGRADISVPTDTQLLRSISSIVTKPMDVDEIVDALRRSVQLWKEGYEQPDGILLIEDNDGDADLVEAYLSLSQYEGRLKRVRRLADALELLDRERFGLVITDLTLPAGRGIDAVLRLQNAAAECPLIVVSGLEDEHTALQALQAGAQDFLVKGEVDPAGLMRSIRYAFERKRTEHDLTRLAHFDPLTGLANRASFNEQLAQILGRARRRRQLFALAFVDLDDFKPVNDRHGHAVGDQVLVEVGRRLQEVVREYDVVARLGGDEFAIVLDGLSSPAEANEIAQRMLNALAEPCRVANIDTGVTASIGIARYPDAGSTAGDLVKAADHAMYAAKRGGRNTYAISGGPAGQVAPPVAGPPAALRQALDAGEFRLHYQPVYDVHAQAVTAVEGLLRWQRGTESLSLPQEFLHLIEHSGMMEDVGAWVLRSACSDLKRLFGPSTTIRELWLNASAHQVEGSLARTVEGVLQDQGFEPGRLQLEVTEAAILSNPDHALNVLCELGRLGVGIALDDFGSGHASLSMLHTYPIGTVKLVRSLVARVETEPRALALVRGICSLAHELEARVVAVGVETPRQQEVLVGAGVDRLQGFLFGRPVPPAQLRTRPLAP